MTGTRSVARRSTAAKALFTVVLIALIGLTYVGVRGAGTTNDSAVTSEAGAPVADPGEESARTDDDIMVALNQREAEPPVFVSEDLADASLSALQANGVLDRISLDPSQLDSTQTALRVADDPDTGDTGTDDTDGASVLVPIVHYIDCEIETCAAVIGWANGQSLAPTEPVLSLGHGGIELYHVEIRQIVPAVGRAIAAQADRIHRGVEGLEDDTIVYARLGSRHRNRRWGGGSMTSLSTRPTPCPRGPVGFLRRLLVAAPVLIAGVVAIVSYDGTQSEVGAAADPTEELVNFETPHVHPIDLTPDRRTLVAVNTAAHRLEVFNVAGGDPDHVKSIPVGLDPVSVRARTNNEVWVVNHLSDSISVVDLATGAVRETLLTENEPADVVFAGSPERAFVTASEANRVNVFDPNNLSAGRQSIAIAGEDPRSLAVSPDGATVYAAIFESGNRTTAVSGGGSVNARNVVSRAEGPYGGQNPPPNDGNSFDPPISSAIGTPPRTAMIVREDSSGRWMDDNNGDWSIFVDGSLASLTNRSPGWQLVDNDIAVINTSTLAVNYRRHLMNINMAIAVNPVNGNVTTVGTDADNEVRFEPNLNGNFVKVVIADTAGSNRVVSDLNPHLTYATPTVAASERERSVGDPRGIAWTADGSRAFVTGMGSNNVIVTAADGRRFGRIEVGEGPTGIVLDDARSRGYVMNKFDGSISVVNLSTLAETSRTDFFDPTPQVVKDGRKFLYDTHFSSGTGHLSCASCHVDARTDRLSWDLGDPQGDLDSVPNASNFNGDFTGTFNTVSPMKGPMLTQTLQDIMDFPTLHWRADRDDLADFNGTFANLMGRPTPITTAESDAFGAFLDTIHLPPNPYQRIDGSRPSTITLPNGQTASSSTMNSLRGSNSRNNNCLGCHSNGQKRNNGANQELGQSFTAAPLVPMYDRLGFWPDSTSGSTSGFGYFHDGADNLAGAARTNTAESQSDMLAEIMTLEGPTGGLRNNEVRQDAHAGVASR